MRKSNNQQGVLPSSPKIDPNTRLFRRLHGAVEVGVEKLEKRVASLQKEVEALRSLLKIKVQIAPTLKLTTQDRAILDALMGASGNAVKVSILTKFIHRAKSKAKDNALKVAICKIRKVLRPHGILIHTKYRYGYLLSSHNYEKLLKLRG